MSLNTWIFDGSDKVKEAIKEHPDYLLVFEADGGYSPDPYVGVADVRLGEVLTITGPNPNKTYLEYRDLVDDVEEEAYGLDLNETEQTAWAERQIGAYDKYWKKAIIVEVQV